MLNDLRKKKNSLDSDLCDTALRPLGRRPLLGRQWAVKVRLGVPAAALTAPTEKQREWFREGEEGGSRG